MKRRGSKCILLLALAFLVILLLLVGQACDPAVPLQIENRTDMVLTIFVEGVNDGQVEPNKSIKIKDVGAISSYLLIEARNSEGEVIFSKKFSIPELNDADWKVVIPP